MSIEYFIVKSIEFTVGANKMFIEVLILGKKFKK